MRLLKLDPSGKFSLTEFFGNRIPPYAILSHTWGPDDEEVTFKDLVDDTGTDKPGYTKLRFCGQWAAQDNLEYFWVDTACIDKSSSAELAESINSMFQWYRGAAKCYVYLRDVSVHDYDQNNSFSQSAFRASRWFTRGWTLQELIAPSSVEFFSVEGNQLGEKRSMEQLIHEITGIAVKALQGAPLSEFGISERFSWAARRQTTRKEDEAYSLLGIFDVYMPLIYGEGEKASIRLKEEVDKYSRNVHARRDIQRWLSPSNVADDLETHVAECMQGSCEWLFTSSSLQMFQSSATSALAQIQGRPGAGKSTTAGFLINHLLSQRGTIVLYFFCKASDVEKRQSTHVLRTILSQLLRADERLYPMIQEIYEQSGRSTADSHNEIEAALSAALANTRDTSIFIVIDALDECQDVPKLLEWIRRCIRSPRSTIRVLVTSRPMALAVLPDHSVYIDDVQGTAQHIEAYLTQRVNGNSNLRGTDLGRLVISEVFKAADCLWLYARLMMDEIERLASSALIERQLQRIPRGLHQLYTQILQSSEQYFSSDQIRFAQQIFLWLDIDDYLPKFLSTKYQGLSYKTLGIILQYVNFGQPVFNPIALAREVCSPLVTIRAIPGSEHDLFQISTRSNSPMANSDFELDYVHHTAEQYIMESFDSPLTDVPQVLRPRRLRHFNRAVVAMWYFSESSESESYLNSLRRYPHSNHWNTSYFDMAYGVWGILSFCKLDMRPSSDDLSEISKIIHAISDFITSSKCLRWIETAIIVNYSAGFYHLLLNVVKAEKATLCADISGAAIWKEYQDTRLRFLSIFAYVLQLTGPSLPIRFNRRLSKPNAFDSDPLAREILGLGKYWQSECEGSFG